MSDHKIVQGLQDAIDGNYKTTVFKISPALAKQLKLDYLHTMSMSELAHWLIHSFTPARYYNKNDVIKEACLLLCDQAGCKYGGELITKLWAMHGVEPPSNVVEFKRRNK